MADELRAAAAASDLRGGGGDGDIGRPRGPKSERGRRTGAVRDVVGKNLTLGAEPGREKREMRYESKTRAEPRSHAPRGSSAARAEPATPGAGELVQDLYTRHNLIGRPHDAG